jgi:hypothetical protein
MTVARMSDSRTMREGVVLVGGVQTVEEAVYIYTQPHANSSM